MTQMVFHQLLQGCHAVLKTLGADPAALASRWHLADEAATSITALQVGDKAYRIIESEPLGPGFSLSLLGAHYLDAMTAHPALGPYPEPHQRARLRAYLVSIKADQGENRVELPLLTVLEDPTGHFHLLEVVAEDGAGFWTLFTVAAHLLLLRGLDPIRYDSHGDFLELGAPCIIERHSTERVTKHLSRKVVYDDRECTHCLRCAVTCNEMMTLVSDREVRLLGPSEDFCTNCGLCQKRCPYLEAKPKTVVEKRKDPGRSVLEVGAGIYLYQPLCRRYREALKEMEAAPADAFPYHTRVSFAADGAQSWLPVQEQRTIEASPGRTGSDPPALLATFFTERGEHGAVLRIRHRAAVVMQTDSGELEKRMAADAMKLGMDVVVTSDPFVPLDQEPAGASSASFKASAFAYPANEACRTFVRLGLWQEAPPSRLWSERKIDLVLAPRADRLPVELHRQVLQDTGRHAQILSPNLPQAQPVTTSPLINALARACSAQYLDHPELLAAETELARRLLQDIPRNHALLHARYRPLAFASGHTACPSCAEARILAIPVYMAMAMSIARGQLPQVYFTCETGCMSETLNKMGEVSQKVPGGRTVFGGGFAFGEAFASTLDRSVRMGLLEKGKRYVISQGGDGGSVIGLPAWLNALRQQAYLIRQRYPNALHFITITDTQVYSNTGGESSATSMIGMGTLTTPMGRFLLGNQKIQWNLINLAAEFPNVLVGAGHSADTAAIQEFWQFADRLNQSGIRWDVTPCPETGKFFGDDPDDLAEIMSHAGMIPQLVFYGRFRKRIAPYHPEDRDKPYQEWRRQPKPILYWLQRDPRYKALLRRDPETGRFEPKNLTAHFLIRQLQTYRDALNRQIDLETHLVRQSEEWVQHFLDDLKQQRLQYRHRLEQFPYAFLFDSEGEWKPEYGPELARELVLRMLGWQEMQRYVQARDQFLESQDERTEELLAHLEKLEEWQTRTKASGDASDAEMSALLERIDKLAQDLKRAAHSFTRQLHDLHRPDPVEEELFADSAGPAPSMPQRRKERLFVLLDGILEERALAKQTELQQFRLAQQLKDDFLATGGLIRSVHTVSKEPSRLALRRHVEEFGPFTVGVASLAGDRGIAINRIFAQFFTAKGAWAGMAWQFGSSKRGTPVLSATFVDSRPLQRKDAMHSFPVAVLVVTNYEEMKREPDLFFAQLLPHGILIINHSASPEKLWQELVAAYPEEISRLVVEMRSEPVVPGDDPRNLPDHVARRAWGRRYRALDPQRQAMARKMAAMVGATMVSVDMDGIMQKVTGSSKAVSNLVAVAPVFEALRQLGFPFNWDRDRDILTRGFPGAVLKQPQLLQQYYRAMETAGRERLIYPGRWYREVEDGADAAGTDEPGAVCIPGSKTEHDPGEYLMIMGGTLAGMVLSQIAMAEHPLFYVGFPITPAGNPFYAMADAFANGHPYIVVDEVNPSEKVAAEKLIGVARMGGFLPVTFTASQGWRLFTEIIPQFVGARLEGLFLLARRALAAPNLNIEESHTDFMSFRDDGGIMLAPKSIQEYVPSLYLARLLTHFAKLPVILSIGGITDTHKIGLVKVPPDEQVRQWLQEKLQGFDFLEHKLLNRQASGIVHGPSGTAAVYQETQSEVEKAHQAVARVLPYAVEAVEELTGIRLDPIEEDEEAARPETRETVFILQGSLYPNAVEALQELVESGWNSMGCLSVRWFNPFPEEPLWDKIRNAKRIVVLDRSNSFGHIPPLASRVFTTIARRQAASAQDPLADANGCAKVLRSLVGGLGGREITVAEMKEVLLSTHLLFHPPATWEVEKIRQWLETDPLLAMLLEEAAALEVRNTDRHTRLPAARRDGEAIEAERRARLNFLRECLLRKDYPALLANYGRVEFIGAKEVLKETTLLQQVVLHIEIRLAREAVGNEGGQLRHAWILANYSQDEADHRLAQRLVNTLSLSQPVPRRLAAHLGLLAQLPEEALVTGEEIEAVFNGAAAEDELRELQSCIEETAPAESPPEPPEPGEIERISAIIRELVERQGSRPLFFNPEDYQRELVRRLRSDPASNLSRLLGDSSGHDSEEILRGYLARYRDVIDGHLQREVLVQHHAPELAELFEGTGEKRLRALIQALSQEIGDPGKPQIANQYTAELEKYLLTRVLPKYPKHPTFYLDYFRHWVAPQLLQDL